MPAVAVVATVPVAESSLKRPTAAVENDSPSTTTTIATTTNNNTSSYSSALDILFHATQLHPAIPKLEVTAPSLTSDEQALAAVLMSPVSNDEPAPLHQVGNPDAAIVAATAAPSAAASRKRGRPRSSTNPAKMLVAAENLIALMSANGSVDETPDMNNWNGEEFDGGDLTTTDDAGDSEDDDDDDKDADFVVARKSAAPVLKKRRLSGSSLSATGLRQTQSPLQGQWGLGDGGLAKGEENAGMVVGGDSASHNEMYYQQPGSSMPHQGYFQGYGYQEPAQEENSQQYYIPTANDSTASNSPNSSFDTSYNHPTSAISARISKPGKRLPSQPVIPPQRTNSSTSSNNDSTSSAKRYECDQCNRTFSRLFNLKSHLQTHDPSRTKSFSCQVCGVGFCRQQDLMRHGTVHDKSRVMVCPMCPGKTFSRKDALRRHIRLNGCCDVSLLDSM